MASLQTRTHYSRPRKYSPAGFDLQAASVTKPCSGAVGAVDAAVMTAMRKPSDLVEAALAKVVPAP